MHEANVATGRARAVPPMDDLTRTKALTYYLCGWPADRIALALGLSRTAVRDLLRTAGADDRCHAGRRRAV